MVGQAAGVEYAAKGGFGAASIYIGDIIVAACFAVNAFGDIYVTNPPAGSKQNDILLTTGLNISFAH
jgi:L-aminopeptidase/D-esterase-like protein